ncbi:MAG: choice-of-anchor J domain-containing protein [Clostridia bacterium]|nr:choice-of-anchor J domain-containing protein [Clostridia bacterium]
MKKTLAILIAAFMAFTCFALPASGESKADGKLEASTRNAVNLDDALNVPGGSLVFETDAQYSWVVSGDAAKSSNEGVANSTSSVWTSVTVGAGSILSFDYMSCGEGSYEEFDWDGLRVYVDGVKILHKGYDHVWRSFVCELEAGAHEIRFTYKKDESYDAEGDCAYIDNVYVGSPDMPEQITVESMRIPMGRRACAEYTVLPESVFDKSVTFSTADPSIARVDENGLVFAVSEGSTTLTVTSCAEPSVSGTATVTVSPEIPTAKLEGYVTLDIDGNAQGCWIDIASYEPSNILVNAENMPDTWAGAYAGGNVYGYLAEQNGQDRRFYIMNADTFEVEYLTAAAPDIVYAMAYDHHAGRMLAIVGMENRYLAEVDIETGEMTQIAAISGVTGKPMTLAIDLRGNAYVLGGDTNNSRLYRMNTETAVCTLIGGTGLGMNYVQSMAFDDETGLIYWARLRHQESFGLYSIDPATAQTEELGAVGGRCMEITCLFVRNDFPLGSIDANECAVTFVDGTNGAMIGRISVETGTVLNESDFPTPPVHHGREFLGWDYDGAPVVSDLTVTALYGEPDSSEPPTVTQVWDFETNPYQQGFTTIDRDGDGHDWEWRFGNNWEYTFYEGYGYMASASFDGETLMPLTPDNWLVTPEFIADELSFWANGQDTDYSREYVGVFISTDGGASWSDEIAGWTVTGQPKKYTVDLRAYSGQSIVAALRHYIVSDMYWLNLDYIELYCDQASVLGDADLNGSVTVADAILALRHSLGLYELTGRALAQADVDGNGSVTVADAVAILRYAMDLIDNF